MISSYKKPKSLGNNIYCIDSKYVRSNFASIHFIIENNKVVIIDTGTNYSCDHVLKSLKEFNLNNTSVEWIILTHIHLDHAGGAGKLMNIFPNAKLGVHPRGKKHMVDPKKLWTSVVGVYGQNQAEKQYGKLEPVMESRIHSIQEGTEINFQGRIFQIWDAPGHAKHHIFIKDSISKAIFTGDTFGVSYREFDNENGAFIFISSTPTQFDPQAFRNSIYRIIKDNPPHVFLTHYSKLESIKTCGNELLKQIDEYVAISESCKYDGKQISQNIEEKLTNLLLKKINSHGFYASKAKALELINADLSLNSSGLVCWVNQN